MLVRHSALVRLRSFAWAVATAANARASASASATASSCTRRRTPTTTRLKARVSATNDCMNEKFGSVGVNAQMRRLDDGGPAEADAVHSGTMQHIRHNTATPKCARLDKGSRQHNRDSDSPPMGAECALSTAAAPLSAVGFTLGDGTDDMKPAASIAATIGPTPGDAGRLLAVGGDCATDALRLLRGVRACCDARGVSPALTLPPPPPSAGKRCGANRLAIATRRTIFTMPCRMRDHMSEVPGAGDRGEPSPSPEGDGSAMSTDVGASDDRNRGDGRCIGASARLDSSTPEERSPAAAALATQSSRVRQIATTTDLVASATGAATRPSSGTSQSQVQPGSATARCSSRAGWTCRGAPTDRSPQ
jgi:hypothetical protein